MKNLNSFKAAKNAIKYEAARQKEVLENGGEVTQETRRWDDDKGISYSMRSKEDAQDYRYFPEPDLANIVIDSAWIEKIRAALPELPQSRCDRYIKEYNLSEYEASKIAAQKSLANFLDAAIEKGASAKAACNWLLGDISRVLNEKGLEPSEIPFSPEALYQMINFIEKGEISNTAGKKVIEALFSGEDDVSKIIKDNNLAQNSDKGALGAIVDEVLAGNAQSVSDYKGGKAQALGFLVGQCMKASRGSGNPQMFNEILREKLEQ
jgi:aspartyl-tRNA(Asn)/glutamyl-tRNA(Gln) amidotransferase subunit B